MNFYKGLTRLTLFFRKSSIYKGLSVFIKTNDFSKSDINHDENYNYGSVYSRFIR